MAEASLYILWLKQSVKTEEHAQEHVFCFGKNGFEVQ
jgi:hypothetical protein